MPNARSQGQEPHRATRCSQQQRQGPSRVLNAGQLRPHQVLLAASTGAQDPTIPPGGLCHAAPLFWVAVTDVRGTASYHPAGTPFAATAPGLCHGQDAATPVGSRSPSPVLI